MALIPVHKEQVEIGTPLACTLFDAEGRPLFRPGEVIADAQGLDELLARGLYRDPAAEDEAASKPAAPRLQLQPGDNLQIQPWDTPSERHMVKVVGHLAPVSLLVTAPAINGKLLFVREGQVFLVRGFVGQDALAYRTRVLKTQLSPFPYLHLAYPETVQSTRIRKSARTRVDLVTAIGGASGNVAGRVADLSMGGARVLSAGAIAAIGDEVRLSFRVQPGGMDIYLSLRAVVRTFQPESTHQAPCTTGLEFIDLSEQERLALMSVVYQNLVQELV
ncbi:flagellar brake protein [Stutzerimonas azotifigens]|uniref:flagellar brake protein n=1 Tax=Stutzerimonas azotifigens TaxID=291995 RepID=UPI00040DA4C4|nr:flagellar brake protein [Stutzerimonas azotifigens]